VPLSHEASNWASFLAGSRAFQWTRMALGQKTWHCAGTSLPTSALMDRPIPAATLSAKRPPADEAPCDIVVSNAWGAHTVFESACKQAMLKDELFQPCCVLCYRGAVLTLVPVSALLPSALVFVTTTAAYTAFVMRYGHMSKPSRLMSWVYLRQERLRVTCDVHACQYGINIFLNPDGRWRL